ncbi:unnamed protein product [Colias eurytheme]|nr:unnamed protein product [Colias eurytheme]
MNQSWIDRFKRPFHPAWLDWCDPYHCNDYHRIVCGLNRKSNRFKWFQSGCHLVLSNLCAHYRGSLKYDIVDNKYCSLYVMFLRMGCPSECTLKLEPVCGVSLIDSHVVLFRNRCDFKKRNCEGSILEEYEEVDMEMCCFIQRCSNKASQTTPLHERIEKLKQQLKDEIKHKIFENVSPEDKHAFSDENYDLIQDENVKITPIVRAKQKRQKTLTAVNVNVNATSAGTPMFRNQSQLRSRIKKKKKPKAKKPLDIFYRRYNEEILNTEIQWTHCQYMITPFLTGVQTDVAKMKKLLNPKDPTVVRLLQLLSIDATALNKEDIYSILYQISNLNIRLFQWDVPSIKHLLNVVIRDKVHNFRTLKHSLSALFSDWKLDVSNATSLLKQTRIFRPPCVRVSDSDGSTKWKKISIYPKKTQATTKCEDDDDSRHRN